MSDLDAPPVPDGAKDRPLVVPPDTAYPEVVAPAKRSGSLQVVVAVDGNGRQLDVTSAPGRPRGVKSLLRWARHYGERLWAVEDVRHVAGGL
ncbi:hypothetical protein [Micromonospora sp. DPT]|uniref:hypothetical protein n=1 Tax=Micromonospora sp. DPT TaxID=3142975 RepID=UPI0032086F4A